jgi:hypothetical protein
VRAANIISPTSPQATSARDDLDIPDFLRLSAAERRHAWEHQPPKPTPAFARAMTETERAYRASIEREKAARRAADEGRFQVMRAKTAQERAERQAIQQAIASNSSNRTRPPRHRPAAGKRKGPTVTRRAR